MKKERIVLMLWLVVAINFVTAQEICESPKENLVDLNSITKCSITKSEDPSKKRSKRISVRVSASRRNLIKRRRVKKAIKGVGNVNTAGVEDLKKNVEVSKNIFLKTNLDNITSKLSSEQARSALAFEEVDKIPLFKSCKEDKEQESLDCFNEQMMLHIQKHFRYPNEAVLSKTEGEVWIRFIIDENGNVTNIKTLGPDNGKLLTEEAIRVVSNLPKFVAATKKGKNVFSKFGFPINFSLEE